MAEPEPDIDDFMEMMDRELAKTNIGKSFENNPLTSKSSQVKA